MKHWTHAIITIACMTGSVALAGAADTVATQPGGGHDAGGIHWVSTWEQARQQAQRENKPIFIHFTTDWCTWCREIESKTYPTPEARSALEGFVPLQVNCTDTSSPEGRKRIALFKQFEGTGYPYLVMVTADGVRLETISGYVPPAPFAMTLNRAKGFFKEWTAFQQWAKTADRAGYEYAQRAMAINAKLGRTDHAAEAARQVLKLDPDNKRGNRAVAALALLQAVQEATKTQPATTQQAEDMAEWAKIVRTDDPTNEKGILQNLLVIEALSSLRAFTMTEDADQRGAMLDKAAESLDALQDVGRLPEQQQVLWAYLGQFRAMLGQNDQAIQALRNAIQTAPESPMAKQLTETLNEFSKQE